MTCIILVFTMVVLDIITGLLQALKVGNFKSSKMKEGLLSKSAIIVGLVLIYALDYMLPSVGVTFEIPVIETFTIYVTLMEFSSILENLSKINPQLSEILSKFFNTIEKESEKDEN